MKNLVTFSIFALLLFPASSLAADLAAGKAKYGQLCASCHGPEGKGDGPVAAALPADQKPASFLTAKFKKVTDDASMKELIEKGGPAMGLSPLMAAIPALKGADLDNVIAYVRSLKQ